MNLKVVGIVLTILVLLIVVFNFIENREESGVEMEIPILYVQMDEEVITIDEWCEVFPDKCKG